MEKEKIIKINLGCGKDKKEGFVGVDIDPETKPDITASALDLPFEKESVDEVYSSHLVEHFTPEEAKKFFDEVYRVLKPGASAYIKIDREWSRKKLLKKDPTHKYRFAAREIEDMVKKFSKYDVKSRIFFLGFRHHLRNFTIPNKKIFVRLEK